MLRNICDIIIESILILQARLTFAVLCIAVIIVMAAYYCLIILQEFVIFREQAKGCDEIGW